MYGTGVGTGVSGAAAAAGIATGSYWLLAVAFIALLVMAWTLTSNARRRAADQRP